LSPKKCEQVIANEVKQSHGFRLPRRLKVGSQ